MKRRDFVWACGSLLAAMGLNVRTVFADPGSGTDLPASRLAGTDWESLLNQTFGLHSGAMGPVRMTLTEFREHHATMGLQQFTLRFSGLTGMDIPEGTYPMVHPKLGRFSLYLQPVARVDGGGKDFRAEFSLLS